ncbi:TPA: DUF6119 family protein [Legionella pneumophila]|uniref:DUF6119 family protein n=1 Tax=Legionella pneumophila TaxID=446 RepID=UPI000693E3A8|nr:TIGR04141 family sporadically distributed protein [Legionella pneumophila]
MSKARPFSIYLLKSGFNATNALKEENNLIESIDSKLLPENATLYLLDNSPTPPWWKSYFGIEKELSQVLKGAIVFLSVNNRCFAITFGHVSHNLKDSSYEYDFGILVTLNAVDSKKLKSLDTLEPGSARRQRIQLPLNSELTYFDFDRDNTILKSLTGKVKDEYKSLFKHSTGSSSIRISSDLGPEGLHSLCQKLLILYESKSYLTEFPDIQNIVPVRDPQKIKILNDSLVRAMQNKDDSITLTIPELIDYKEGVYITFFGEGAGKVYDDVTIEHYYEYIEQNGIELYNLNLDLLKKHHLQLTNEDGHSRGIRANILKCLLFDAVIEEQKETYHICEGNWYYVDRNFVSELSEYLDSFCADTTLPDYNHKNEGEFNKHCADMFNNCLCLDRSNISPKGQRQVEPCDIVEAQNNRVIILHHVKRSTDSATLSHLFNQGLNSIRLLRDDSEAFENFSKLINNKLQPQIEINYSVHQEFKIIYQIITHKDKIKKSLNLPLFSRISLKRAIKELRRMRVDVEFCFVNDITPPSSGKKKNKQSRKLAKSESYTRH